MRTALIVAGSGLVSSVAAWGGLVLFFPQTRIDDGIWVMTIALGVGLLGGVVWRLTRRSRTQGTLARRGSNP